MGTDTQAGWITTNVKAPLPSYERKILREDIPWQQENVEESRHQAQIGCRKEARKHVADVRGRQPAEIEITEGEVKSFAGASLGVIVGTSLLSGLLLNGLAPEAAGSGVPQLKLAFWRDFGFVPQRLAWVKFLGGVLAVGGGSSLGREGPSIQLAASVASNLSGALGTAKTGRRRATAAGAAAGLAATFTTPLASIAFVLEEILGDLNSSLLGSVVVAAVVGAFVVHACLGKNPAFGLPSVDADTWNGRLLVPIVAMISAVLGVWFQRGALGLRKAFRSSSLSRIPAWLRPPSDRFSRGLSVQRFS